MRLFRVVSQTGEVLYVYATSNQEAQRLAVEFSPTFRNADIPQEIVPGAKITGATGSPVLIQVDGKVVPLGALSESNPLSSFANLGGGTRSTSQIINEFGGGQNRATQRFGVDPSSRAATDIPQVPEAALPSVALQRVLDSIGRGSGVLGAVGRTQAGDIANLGSFGIAGNLDTGIFANQGAGFELQDLFQNVLGPQFEGTAPRFGLSKAARDLFLGGASANPGLDPFFNPQFGTARGESGLSGFTGNQAAEALAQLALTASRGRFGALSGALPTASNLVTQFGSQPTQQGQPARFEDFLQGRLGIR